MILGENYWRYKGGKPYEYGIISYIGEVNLYRIIESHMIGAKSVIVKESDIETIPIPKKKEKKNE